MATIRGTGGNDVLTGTGADDRLAGLGGNDTLDGAGGNDTLNGGAGNDTYFVDADGDVIVDGSGRETVVATLAGYALGNGLENLFMRGSSYEIQADGNALDNVIRDDRADGGAWIDGGDGDDTLLGGDGWDEFSFRLGSGDYGNDVVDGGAGSDGLRAGARSAVVIDFRDGTLSGGGAGGSGTVSFANIEHAAGGAFDDLLIAGSAGVSLYGADGDDTLQGGAGNDYLASDYDGTSAPQSPLIAGNDHVTGGGGNDRLVTGAGNDILDGGAGNDSLDAGGGNDTLYWQASDAIVDGGDGSDTLRLRSGNLNLTVVDNGVVQDVEAVNMTGGGNNRLTLSQQDILDLSSSTDTLKVLGNAGDSVNIAGSFEDQGVSGSYHRYGVGAATLLVDTDITTVV